LLNKKLEVCLKPPKDAKIVSVVKIG